VHVHDIHACAALFVDSAAFVYGQHLCAQRRAGWDANTVDDEVRMASLAALAARTFVTLSLVTQWCVDWARRCPTATAPLHHRLLRIVQRQDEPLDSWSVDVQHADLFRFLRCHATQCAQQGCDQHGGRVCGGCGAVRYCSRACQKQAWKRHQFPCVWWQYVAAPTSKARLIKKVLRAKLGA